MDGDGRLELAKPVDFCKMTPYERQRVQDAWRSEPRSIKIPSFDVPHQVRRVSNLEKALGLPGTWTATAQSPSWWLIK